MSANVFISFASPDRKVALTLCSALENRGFNCWISARDIQPGENFQTAIVKAIRNAKIMLLVFTANSNTSEEMTKELALASQFKVMVVPLRIEDVAPNDAFAYEFATRQWIDFFSDWEAAIQQLSRRLEYAVTQPAAAAKTAEAALAAEALMGDPVVATPAKSAPTIPTSAAPTSAASAAKTGKAAPAKGGSAQLDTLFPGSGGKDDAAPVVDLDKRRPAAVKAAASSAQTDAPQTDAPKSRKLIYIAAAAVAVLAIGGVAATVAMRGEKPATAEPEAPLVMNVNATPATPITDPVTAVGPFPETSVAATPAGAVPVVPPGGKLPTGATVPGKVTTSGGYTKVTTPVPGDPNAAAPVEASKAPPRPPRPKQAPAQQNEPQVLY